MSYAIARNRDVNSDINKLYPEDRAVHEWYRFVLSFPPHLVRTYLDRFGLTPDQRVLAPFCGTGTVLVESKKQGIPGVGIEANPMAHLASQVKVDWSADPDKLMEHARRVATTCGLQVIQKYSVSLRRLKRGVSSLGKRRDSNGSMRVSQSSTLEESPAISQICVPSFAPALNLRM